MPFDEEQNPSLRPVDFRLRLLPAALSPESGHSG